MNWTHWLTSACLLMACSSETDSDRSDAVKLRSESLSGDCQPGLVCPAGQTCTDLSQYGQKSTTPVCVLGTSPCDALSCPEGTVCAIDDQFPPSPYCSDGR